MQGSSGVEEICEGGGRENYDLGGRRPDKVSRRLASHVMMVRALLSFDRWIMPAGAFQKSKWGQTAPC